MALSSDPVVDRLPVLWPTVARQQEQLPLERNRRFNKSEENFVHAPGDEEILHGQVRENRLEQFWDVEDGSFCCVRPRSRRLCALVTGVCDSERRRLLLDALHHKQLDPRALREVNSQLNICWSLPRMKLLDTTSLPCFARMSSMAAA
jgi:hypothetical protein